MDIERIKNNVHTNERFYSDPHILRTLKEKFNDFVQLNEFECILV